MRLPPYPKYKPSGVEWLGDVPEHWEALPLKRRHRVVNGGTPSSTEDTYWDGDINWVTPEDLGRNDSKRIGSSRRTLSLEGLSNCGAQLVPRDSIVVSTRAPIGHVAVTERESCTNQGCRALIPEGARAEYIYYTIVASRPVLQAAGKGTTFMELSAGLLGLHAVPLPPPEEQRSIADFLDRETAKIDTLVTRKQTLIERLKEKRTALISRTVTRGLPPEAARAAGLDPHPKLKPSGIDWLGDVPNHWDVRKLGHISTVVRGASPRPAGDSRYFDGDFIPWITVGELTRDSRLYLSSTESMLTQEGAALSRVMRHGTLVLTNSGATLGVPKILAITGCANDGVVALENLRPDVDIVFIYYFLASMTDNLRDRIKQGSGQPNLNTDIIRGLPVPCPPASEQRVIAGYLVGETARMDAMVAKVGIAIDRLQEYRTALVTAAVTGKIDVRAAAA